MANTAPALPPVGSLLLCRLAAERVSLVPYGPKGYTSTVTPGIADRGCPLGLTLAFGRPIQRT